jgi:hypothetical protein
MMTIGRDHNGRLSGPRPVRAPTSRGAWVWKRRQYITMGCTLDEDFRKYQAFARKIPLAYQDRLAPPLYTPCWIEKSHLANGGAHTQAWESPTARSILGQTSVCG